MIKFDPELLTVDTLHVVKVVGGVNSSIHHINEDDELEKIPVSFSIVNTFKKAMKASTFLQPVVCSFINYDGIGIALDNHEGRTTVNNSIITVLQRIKEWEAGHYIYFDGVSAYGVPKGILDEPDVHHPAKSSSSADGSMYNIDVKQIELRGLPIIQDAEEFSGISLVYRPPGTEIVVVGPPVTKYETEFDHQQADKYVNLTFALSSLKSFSQLWGDGVVEFINLPALMLQLGTVNLPSLPTPVKHTTSCGMSFNEAVIWMMGFIHRSDNMTQMLIIRRQMRYLLIGKGLTRKSAMNSKDLFLENKDESDVVLQELDELKQSHRRRLDAQMEASRIG